MQITPTVNGANADIEIKTLTEGDGEVEFSILDAAGSEVLTGKGNDATVTLENAHLWDLSLIHIFLSSKESHCRSGCCSRCSSP